MMTFIADRAGVNDFCDVDSPNIGSVRMAVIVSTETDVLEGYLNGQKVDVVENAGVFRFSPSERQTFSWLRRDGKFVNFRVDLPPQARFLTLATLAGHNPHDDHAVFSGARLEIVRDNPATARE